MALGLGNRFGRAGKSGRKGSGTPQIPGVLPAAPGSFVVNGQSVGLLVARQWAIGAGSFALSGQVAGLAAARLLTAVQGSLAISGQAAGIVAARKLTAAQGAIALTGVAAGLAASRSLQAAPGTFSLTGIAAALQYSANASAAPTLGANLVHWNAVQYTIDTNTLAAGDLIEIQVQAAGGNWTSLLSTISHTVTAGEVAAYHMDLSGNAPTAGNMEARARITQSGGSPSAWSATYAYTVPARPTVNAPVLTDRGSGVMRIAFDGTLVGGDTLTTQVQTHGGSWGTILQTYTRIITSGDFANGYYDQTIAIASGNYDIRTRGTHDAADSNWSNVINSVISAPPTVTFIGNYRILGGDGNPTKTDVIDIGNPIFIGTRRVILIGAGGSPGDGGKLLSGTINGVACDRVDYFNTGAGGDLTVASAVVPTGTNGVTVTLTYNQQEYGFPSVGVYIVDDTLLVGHIPTIATTLERGPGASVKQNQIATSKDGFVLATTWIGGAPALPTISPSDVAFTVDGNDSTAVVFAHANGVPALAALHATFNYTGAGDGGTGAMTALVAFR